MNKKITKKFAAGMLSILALGSQISSGSAAFCGQKYLLSESRLKKITEKDEIKLKGIFDVPGLKEALERITTRYIRACERVKLHDKTKFLFDNIKLESDNGRVVVKVKDASFELAYDKLIDEKTGEIEEIEIPYCIKKIDSHVFENILKKANAQGKKIKRVILPECLRSAADDVFANVSVDSVVFKSQSSEKLFGHACDGATADIFKDALKIGAVFVPKRFEEETKEELKNRGIKVLQDFELKSAFNIEGLKEAIMDALANNKRIKFEVCEDLTPALFVGDKKFQPDYSKLKDEKTGKIENLELPYGISGISSPVIHYMCRKCDGLNVSEVGRIVIPDTVKTICDGALYYLDARHVILSKNLNCLNYEAFGHVFRMVGGKNIFLGRNSCRIKEITTPGSWELMLKRVFKNNEIAINVM